MVVERWLLYCRPGFENDCAAEVQAVAAALGGHGFCRARLGHVVFEVYQGLDRLTGLDLDDLVFARQLIRQAVELPELPAADRLTPLLAELRQLSRPFGGFRLERPDTDQGKVLSPLLRSLERLLGQRLDASLGYRPAAENLPWLHLFFAASTHVWLGWSEARDRSPWPDGIPRLKLSRDAPSRSTLKLEEALLTLLTAEQRAARLRPGMTAVDLGAAPGGWTWQMVRRSIRVTAVDNGTLAPMLLDSGLVQHLRTDGFRYRPPRPVDWLLCDMVEQPRRIAALMADWLAEGCCRQALFNLKLPMKRRHEEVVLCRELIARRLHGLDYRLRLRQLYHDRREVTAWLYRV